MHGLLRSQMARMCAWAKKANAVPICANRTLNTNEYGYAPSRGELNGQHQRTNCVIRL